MPDMTNVEDGPPERLRVAIVSDWFLPRQGGIELHLSDLARELAARGHEPQIITTTPGPVSVDGLRVCRLPVRLVPGFDFSISPSLVGMLRAELGSGRFDVVHIHASVVSPAAYAALHAARGLGLPTVLTFHSVLLRMVGVLRLIDRIQGWSRFPFVISAVSELVAAQLRGISPKIAVDVLSNGIDPAFWHVDRSQPGNTGIVSVACTMRLHRKKRPLALMEAYVRARERVRANGRDLVLRIAGEGPERVRLTRYISKHKLAANVTLLGLQTRASLRDLYGKSDIFVLPSRREAFGLAALEARCAGLPVIAMRAAGSSEFLRHGDTGLLAEDDRELADHLARLALDGQLRARLAPPDAPLSRYGWPNVINAHVTCYRKAIGYVSGTQRGGISEMPRKHHGIAGADRNH